MTAPGTLMGNGAAQELWAAAATTRRGQLRRRAAELARSFDGLGAHPRAPERRRQFLALVAPGEEPRRAAAMATMSTCALVAAGFLRGIGVWHRLLAAPYRLGSAGSAGRHVGNVGAPG
jgi:hypothetical protein